MSIQDVRALQVKRLTREIRKSGPLTWSAARLAMWGGDYDRRDARWHNETLQEFIRAGSLALVELPDGDSLIGLPT